jgi:hypothetical protein
MNSLDLTSFLWLVLAGMLLLSRIVFKAKGVAWVKRFLMLWLTSPVRVVWSMLAIIAGSFLLCQWLFISTEEAASYSLLEQIFIGAVCGVLISDGLLNLLLPYILGTPLSKSESTEPLWWEWLFTERLLIISHLFLGIGALLTFAATFYLNPAAFPNLFLASQAVAVVLLPTLIGLGIRIQYRRNSG